MPTMVKQQELRSASISQERPVNRPVEQGGFSRFMQDVLPSAIKGYEDYQKENKDRMTALGRMDELNGIQREVSVFDNNSYEQGKEFQKINSTQLKQDKDFTTQVESMARDGKSADEIWQYGREYLRGTVDSTYYSDLSPDLKETMYQADLKRQLAYQKLIPETMQKVSQERFAFDHNNRVLGLYQDLTSANSPDTYDLALSAYNDKAQVAYMNPSLGNMSPTEATAAIQKDLEAVVDYWKLQLQDPTKANAATAAKLQGFLNHAIEHKYLPMGVAMKMQGLVSGIQTNILASNDIEAGKVVEQQLYKWDVEPDSFSLDKVQQGIDGIRARELRGEISQTQSASDQARYLRYGAERQQKLLTARKDMSADDMLAAGYTLQQWIATGNKESDYINNYEQLALRAPDTTTAGIAMLNQAALGDPSGFALTELAKRGGGWVAGNLLSTISMSDAELQSSETGKQRAAQLQALSSEFKRIYQTKPEVAESFLTGFPEGKRGVIRSALLRSGNVGDMRQAVANAPTTMAKLGYITKANEALKFEHLESGFWGKLTGNNISGVTTQWFGQQQTVNRALTANIKGVVADNIDTLSMEMNDGTPEELALAIQRSGMLVKSKLWDSSVVIVPPRAQTNLAARYASKGLGSATNEYVASAIDIRRAEILKIVGGEAENILATVDKTGNRVQIDILGSDGRRHPKYPRGESMNLVQLDNNINKVLERQGKDPKTGQSKQGSILNYKSESDYGYKLTAPIGKVAVSIQGRPTVLQYSNTASIPFGGNTLLTNMMMNHWSSREGFVTKATESSVPASGGQRSVKVLGLGMNMDAHGSASDGKGGTWRSRAAKAVGNPQATMDMQSDFIAYHHKNLPKLLASANIPVPTQAPYPAKYLPAVTAIADAMWLSPKAGEYMAKVLSQPNASAALEKLKQNRSLYAYQQNGHVHPRSKDLANMVSDYYRNK